MRVLICGGGVIGAATAYFLSRRNIDVTVIERTGIACAASGKSGGFLALDWCDGGPMEALARRSFVLHAKLAKEIGDDYGYRRMTTYSGAAAAGQKFNERNDFGVDWVSDFAGAWPQARDDGDDRAGASRRLHRGPDGGRGTARGRW